MTEIDVCWVTADPEGVDARGFWDQTLIEHLFERISAQYHVSWRHHHHVGIPADVEGCVLVVKAGFPDPEHIQKMIRPLKWVVLFSTSDEEQQFPWWDLTHRKMTRWVTSAKEPHLRSANHLIPVGPTPHGMQVPAKVGEPGPRHFTWGFLGQMTHDRRVAAMRAMVGVQRGMMRTTSGFSQGMSHDDYAATMCDFRFAPAPGGPVCPDTFRAWEAIYAGAVPLLDEFADNGSGFGLWEAMFPEGTPIPCMYEWHTADVQAVMEHAPPAHLIQGWWGLQLLRWERALLDDVSRLSGQIFERPYLSVIINTSPIENNDEVFSETFDSAREAFGDDIPFFVVADGVRPEQEHLREEYEKFLADLAWDFTHHMPPNFFLLCAQGQVHQVELLRRIMPYIETPALVFLEHDTPVEGDIPAKVIADVVTSRYVDLVRLYPEVEIPDEHGYLMQEHNDVNGLPLQFTTQWSQRPHIASTKLYNDFLAKEFSDEARTFVEDRMHSVAQRRDCPYRLAIYAPPGNIKRSRHLDGRGAEPKFDDRLVF